MSSGDMGTGTPPPLCPLLELPPELRNRIYRLARLTTKLSHDYAQKLTPYTQATVKSAEERIVVTQDGHERPALLNTCKQIRSEALKIYYYESRFLFQVHSFNSDAALKMSRTIRSMRLTRRKVQVASQTWHDSPNWLQLVEWIKRYHKRAINLRPIPPAELLARGHSQEPERLVGSLFAVAKQLKGQPWQLVEAILQDLRPNLIAADERWKQD